MKLDDVAKLLSKADPARFKALFPTPTDQSRFEAAREGVIKLVKSVHEGSLDASSFDQLESLAAEFRALYGKLTPKTQIASRSILNEAVLRAEVHHLERSVYLAGVAREKKVSEPYRSQLNSLPTNACCSRYRQISKLRESVRSKLADDAYSDLEPLFDELRRSYLTQFVYFASQAFLENPAHPMVAYLHALSSLMRAHELELQGRNAESASLTVAAYEIVHSIKEPNDSMHFMDVQYHKMNSAEFGEMRRLSARHSEMSSRLRYLAIRASGLQENGHGHVPRMSFAFAPIVGWGARSASVAGLVLSVATLLGWDPLSIQASVDALWMRLAQNIPQFSQQASEILTPVLSQTVDTGANSGAFVAAHTGGFAAHTGGVAMLTSHAGSIGAQLAALASHTGGFA